MVYSGSYMRQQITRTPSVVQQISVGPCHNDLAAVRAYAYAGGVEAGTYGNQGRQIRVREVRGKLAAHLGLLCT
jgi:hypothetical protein